MIIPDEALLDAKLAILQSMNHGKLSQEDALLKLLELDPHDGTEWLALGMVRKEQGRIQEVVDCFWQAANANPCRYESFLGLGTLTEPSDPLAAGLLSLAGQKALALEQAEEKNRETWEMAVAVGARLRGTEPQSVTDRLRPHRLVQEMLAPPQSGMARHVVEQILEYREACTPLLLGTLRASVDGMMPEDYNFPAIAALALLGEMGDPSVLPTLLYFLDDDDLDLRHASTWAVARIARTRPAEVLPQLRERAAAGPTSLRWGMAQVYSGMRGIDGVTDALIELLEGLGELPPGERDLLFQAVAMAVFDTQGPEARAVVQTLIARYSSVLPPHTPPRCLKRTGEEPADELTIYDFCCEPFEDEEEEEEEQLFTPAPPKLGRNDPCWCGSGKKYKKCHLAADEAADAESDFEVRRALADFASQEIRPAEMRAALKTYFGRDIQEIDEDEQITFLEWLIHDHTLPRWGRTPVQEYLRVAQLTGEQRRQVEGFAVAVYSLLEVQEVRRGTGVRVRDLLQGGDVFVHDVSSSKGFSKWDCLLSRVVDLGGRHEFAAHGLVVPRSVCEQFREWILADREELGGDWPSYLRANSHRLQQQLAALGKEWSEAVQVSTFDGEPLVFSKAVYQVQDEAALRRGAEACAVLHPDESGGFTWLASEGGTVLGNARFSGDRLILECSSRERLQRGRALLESLAPGALHHLADEFTDWRQARKETKDERERVPPEVERKIVSQFYEQHYSRWPDMPLPALGGRTPRDAVQTAEGRRQVIELLKMMENRAEHERREGRYAYDCSRLKAELGIDSL
jgi:hypothetical protein